MAIRTRRRSTVTTNSVISLDLFPGNSIGVGNDQPAVYSSSSNLDTGFGIDRTPSGWPSSVSIVAFEVGLTSTSTSFTADRQVQVVASNPSNLAPLPGSISDSSVIYSNHFGSRRKYHSSQLLGNNLTKFGGWRGDYGTFLSSTVSANTYSVGVSQQFGQSWEIEFEVRKSSWSSSGANTIITSKAPLIRADATGLTVRLSGSHAPLTPWSSLGAEDNQWLIGKVSFDVSNRLRIWAGNGHEDGWVLVATHAVSGYSETLTSWGGGYHRIGNGQNASGISQIGFGGDIRYVRIYDGSGNLLIDSGIDRQPSSDTGSWSTIGGTVTKHTTGSITGGVMSSTISVRGDLEAPCDSNDFRLILDAQTGVASVDKIRLEYI